MKRTEFAMHTDYTQLSKIKTKYKASASAKTVYIESKNKSL